MAAFGARKAHRLARPDGSRKGGLDERAAPVVRLLNGRARFCTTSSCSGRLVLAQGRAADTNSFEIQKKNCSWLLATHEPCSKEDVVTLNSVPAALPGQPPGDSCCVKPGTRPVQAAAGGMLLGTQMQDDVAFILTAAQMTALEKATGDVVFKFEPFVLHVLCQELQDAQLLHSVAVSAGFRNSGITVGRGGKIMMAVRSTHCLEVPLSHKGKLMVSEEYIEFLIHVANQKMEENIKRIDRFHKSLELALKTCVSADNSPSEETEKSRPVYVHRRKRKTFQQQGLDTPPREHREELEPEEDVENSLDIFAGIMI